MIIYLMILLRMMLVICDAKEDGKYFLQIFIEESLYDE